MESSRIWLDVPYADKDQAKAAGARWDNRARRWYAPQPGMTALEPWVSGPDIPDLLPGEDRTFGSGLFVDLVPASCWFTNVRSCVSERDWERVRRMVIPRAGRRCEACGATADPEVRRWLEVHERWAYDDAARVQTLKRLICLCTYCHRTTHFGFAQVQGYADRALAHLMQVTGMTSDQADRHIDEAFSLWEERSRHAWKLDLSMLTGAGVTVTPPPDASARQAVAGETLRARRG